VSLSGTAGVIGHAEDTGAGQWRGHYTAALTGAYSLSVFVGAASVFLLLFFCSFLFSFSRRYRTVERALHCCVDWRLFAVSLCRWRECFRVVSLCFFLFAISVCGSAHAGASYSGLFTKHTNTQLIFLINYFIISLG
jgi:hypothetical protein